MERVDEAVILAHNHKKKLFRKLQRASIAWLIVFLYACGSSPPPREIRIVEFVPCTGWDENRQPIGITDVFPDDTDHIDACGRLETNAGKISFPVDWRYEGKIIFSEQIRSASGNFNSSLRPTDGGHFEPGSYRVDVILHKTYLARFEFVVQESE
jgi:hypothetical protein